MGVKNAPKRKEDKKALPECHRCPPLRLPHSSSPQIPAHLSHNFLKHLGNYLLLSCCTPPALAGSADEPCQSFGTGIEMATQSVASLGLFWQGPGGGSFLTNVVETTSLSLKNDVKMSQKQIKGAYCFEWRQHKRDLFFVPGSNIKIGGVGAWGINHCKFA